MTFLHRHDVGQDVDRSQHNNNRNGWMDNPRGRSHTRGARGRLRERVKGGRQWGQRETFDIRQRREFNVDDFVSITDTTLLTETLLTRLTELEEFMNSPSVSQENTVKLLKVLTKVEQYLKSKYSKFSFQHTHTQKTQLHATVSIMKSYFIVVFKINSIPL